MTYLLTVIIIVYGFIIAWIVIQIRLENEMKIQKEE
tara:strand:+ start:168 stop:275 length:108 start_codon:yes stop_codon:yes gene_type:complete